MASSIAAQRVHATLQQVLEDRGPLTADEALAILRQVAEELARWHAQGRLHRSIGLQTVLSTGEGRVHLAPAPVIRSFGGPDVDEEACPWELQTERAVQVPDSLQAARAALADAGIELDPRRIDIYQSGVLLYRLLTGTSVIAYLRSPLSKSQLPPDLRTLVDGCLGSGAGGFASAEKLSAALAERLGPSGMLPFQAAKDSDTSPSLAGDEKRPDTSCGPAPREPAESAPLPFTKLAHYEIVGRIGRGGMGDVFRGYERELHREVAIKVLPDTFADDPDFVRRFRAEAAVAARIAHPNIVHVYFIGEDAGHLFFAMQYVAGQSLADLLAQRPQLEVDEAITIITQVLSGLAAAHAQGVVHRDIKPANILLDAANRRALLGDFGLVKRVSSGENKTATGVIMGTVDYLSPEQGRGKPVDARSDLYSVGVLLYRMLSGRLPFTADSATAMIFQHVYEPPVPLTQVSPNTPAPLAEIVSRLLAKRPEDRYQTADDVRAALQEFAATWMPTGGSPTPARDGRVAAPASPAALSDAQSAVQSDAGESPAAAGPRTAIIRDLAVEDLPRWPAAVAPSRGDGWWQRVRDRILASFQARAPRLAEQWLTTQQHVDGAVAVYEERYAAVNQLVGEAEEVLRDLSAQAACNLQAAQQAERRAKLASGPESVEAAQREQRESQQAAEELLALKAEQEQELQGLRGTQRELGSRLQQLRSQRTILAARLQTAQAEVRTHGGGRSVLRRQWPVWAMKLRFSTGSSRIRENSDSGLVAVPREAPPNSHEFGYAQLQRVWAGVAAGLLLVILSAFLLPGWWSLTGETISGPPAGVYGPLPDPWNVAAEVAGAQQAEWAGRVGQPVRFENQFGIEMLLIPPGSFLMGSPATEPGHKPDEQQVEVTLTQPFYLGRTEITQQQWEAVMGTRPWQGHTGVKEGPSYPAGHVSWLEAVDFCRRLTELERQAGQLPDGWVYRLPTEAQWEHACRAGSETPFYFGTDIGLLTDHAWYQENTKGQGLMSAQPVGRKQPNAFGLHDMYGNVWEWCADGFRSVLPGGTDPEATAPDPAGNLHVMRGGGWDHFADQCRSANRERAAQRWAAGSSGLRVALVQQSTLPATSPVPTMTNSVGMEFLQIPAGEYQRGTRDEEEGAADEKPRHWVRISNDFYVGKFPVTQDVYRKLMGANPSWYSSTGNGSEEVRGMDTSQFPAENMSYFDALVFCNKLSVLEKLPPYYQLTNMQQDGPSVSAATITIVGGDGYRLPTEAEWEYAARAGTDTIFPWGNSLSSNQANFDGNFPFGGAAKGSNLRRPTEVGSYPPNGWGLSDMAGNVWQWVEDWYGADTYQQFAATTAIDPRGPGSGSSRVQRGGSWSNVGELCRTAYRNRELPHLRFGDVGFRVARSLPTE